MAIDHYRHALSEVSKKGKDSIPKAGYRALDLGAHAILALTTKNVFPNGIAGIQFLSPDWVGTILAGIGMVAFKGGSWQKHGSRSVFFGGAHALIGKWVAGTNTWVTSGPDGFRWSNEPPGRGQSQQQRPVVDATP